MKLPIKVCSLLIFGLFSSASWAESPKIPIYVTPFYNSQGPEVDVGKFSNALKTDDVKELENTIKSMLTEKDTLTPEQMFVASIRLYELGKKDEAVYWFYEAQYLARIFVNATKNAGGLGNKGFELKHAYGSFLQLAGETINGYAGCDPDKWIATLKKVNKNNQKTPNLDLIFPGVSFVEKETWDGIRKRNSEGMEGLIGSIEQSKPTWKQQRATNNQDEKYCN